MNFVPVAGHWGTLPQSVKGAPNGTTSTQLYRRLRMMAQDYNQDGLMDFSLEGSAGGKRTSGSGVFINKGDMKFEYVPKNYPEWHSPENPKWTKLKIRLIKP